MSKRTDTNPREHTPDMGFKDLPRFNALVERIRTDNEKKRRTGVDDEQEKIIQTETL